jgi:hypothetical protein
LSIYNVPKLDNAFFSGEYMTYGNGDKMFYPMTSIDIAAHELTHGIVQHTAGLEYLGHSGALNESFSDMIGTAFELYLYERFNSNDTTTDDIQGEADWLCGEDIGKQIKYLRNLQNPDHSEIPQPATYKGNHWADPNNESSDHGGVHTNSGIGNRCFFLLTESLSLDTSLPLVYNCLLKLKKNSDFIDFRNILLECSPVQIRNIVEKCLDDVGLTSSVVSDWDKSPIENRTPKLPQSELPKPELPQPELPQPELPKPELPMPEHKPWEYPNHHIPYIPGLCCPHCPCLNNNKPSIQVSHQINQIKQK